MDRLLTRFISALRNADIRVSTAETIDAFSVVELVGYRNRQLLKDSLALVLPKTLDEKAAFDACFDRFFSSREHESLVPPGFTADDETGITTDAAGDAGGGQSRGGADPATRPDPMSSLQSALGQLLLRGNPVEINAAINAAGQQVNVHGIEVFTQKGVYTRRILESMGHAELQREIGGLRESAAIPERRLAQDLTRRRDWLRERVRDHVEQQFLLHADVTGRRLREDLLRGIKLSALEQRHYRLLQQLVRRMARRLVSAHSRRRKVFRRGQLHVPRTLRHNLKYDDAIIDLHWKSVRIDRPKIFAICDVSGSVADFARFMLMFLYSLEEVLPKVRSFAFSSELGEVSELFARNGIEDAIALALKRYGSGSTDYGQALADFRTLCGNEIDKRATLIILGDARNNHGDTRTDVLKELHDRSRRLIWLNPEARTLWNTGDSEMQHYAAYCQQVDECGTLGQLERIVGRLLRTV